MIWPAVNSTQDAVYLVASLSRYHSYKGITYLLFLFVVRFRGNRGIVFHTNRVELNP
jgi:hypothetical protein